jgi:hypothetical protein
MNILDRFAYPDEWVSVVDCNDCKKQTPTKETHIVPVDYEYFGVKGYKYIKFVKNVIENHN